MKKDLSELFALYAPTMLRITSRDANGDLVNGAGFHIGSGLIATARHVVEGVDIVELVPNRHAYFFTPVTVEQIYYAGDQAVDVAVLKTNFSLDYYMSDRLVIKEGNGERTKTDFVPLGDHLDDWLGDEYVMTRALVMGFPRVPFANDANLVAVGGEVNAVIDKYTGGHPHFIVSSVPRGGFSGGPAISEFGVLLGIVTESLVPDGKDLESGFTAVISIEPLLYILVENKLYPKGNEWIVRELENPGSTLK